MDLLIPLTFIPGVGLLILSTCTRFIHVNDIISKFTQEECEKQTIRVRRELRRAYYFKNTLTSLYLSVAILVLGSVVSYIMAKIERYDEQGILEISTIIGALFIFIAVFNLIAEAVLNFRLLESHTKSEKD